MASIDVTQRSKGWGLRPEGAEGQVMEGGHALLSGTSSHCG